MSSLQELRNERLNKLKRLVKDGINPYPAKSRRTLSNERAILDFDSISKKQSSVVMAGRILSIRSQGKIVFFDFNDGTAKFQAMLKAEVSGLEVLNLFNDVVDIGDIIEVLGELFITKRNEKTIAVKEWRMLAKALLPLPDKWDGLKDEEERLRKRYLDILVNEEVKDLIQKRSVFWKSVRDFMLSKGFLEVETPILENTTGGAEARPFITHHNALDIDVYLRISPELWLKRLLIAGFPKVFEIGRIFRNEGMSFEHLQDYTQMESYAAYEDYEEGMKFVEELYKYVAEKTFGTLKFKIRGFNIDLGAKWQIYNYMDIIKNMLDIDVSCAGLDEVKNKLEELGIEYDKDSLNLARGVDLLWKHCRKKISGPGFLINVPVFLEPLAKRSEKDPNVVERFQVIIAGSELGKGFSELNDPLDQAERFAEQAKFREAGDEEAQMNDIDFVEALEYGMPPAFGFGLSERLFSFLMNKPARECQIFPLLRPKRK